MIFHFFTLRNSPTWFSLRLVNDVSTSVAGYASNRMKGYIVRFYKCVAGVFIRGIFLNMSECLMGKMMIIER